MAGRARDRGLNCPSWCVEGFRIGVSQGDLSGPTVGGAEQAPWVDNSMRGHTRRLACYAALALGACAAVTQRLQPAASRQHRAVLQERMGGLGDGHNDYAPYPASKDPWLASWAGKGSYRLWARDYESRHGDGTRYNSLSGTHGLAPAEEEPDRLNRKNGWEQAEFFKWVKHQGGSAPEAFQEHGMATMGSEYLHALKRLGINSFADLKDFNAEYDVPSFMCKKASEGEEGEEEETGVISGHADCGELESFARAAKSQPLWFADNKAHLSSDDIQKKISGVREHVKNMLPTLSGGRPWDDPAMYCYSQFPEDPEYSQCMSEVSAASDPVTGEGKRGPSWKEMTRGLWQHHADGQPVVGAGDNKLFGSNWGQLTADLWDSEPHQERNGLNY